MGAIPWGFKSPFSHQNDQGHRSPVAFFLAWGLFQNNSIDSAFAYVAPASSPVDELFLFAPLGYPMIYRYGLGFLLTLLLGTGVGLAQGTISQNGPAAKAEGGLKVGDKAPRLVLPTLEGGTVTWPDDFPGQVVVVNFWATWCDPCVEEIPSLERLRRQLKGSPVTILTVSVGEGDQTEVNTLLEKSRAHFITALDPGGKEALKWGTAKLPETYILRPDGTVQEKVIGAQLWDRGDRIHQLKELAPATP